MALFAGRGLGKKLNRNITFYMASGFINIEPEAFY
jgi:hypothetical protein